MATTVGGLILVVGTGSYRSVERIALFLGLFELAFFVMAWKAAPDFSRVFAEARQVPLRDPAYLWLLAANLGTSIIPWALVYQQSASVDKGLGPGQIRLSRLETLAGVILCQAITSALLIAAAATLGNGEKLGSVGEIEAAFAATLGPVAGRLVFILGLAGAALVAAWFYATIAAMLLAAGALVVSGVNLVSLAVGAGVANAILLPAILLLLLFLARTSLPPALRLHGPGGAATAAALLGVAALGLIAGLAGALG
jgi:hypothetical protein